MFLLTYFLSYACVFFSEYSGILYIDHLVSCVSGDSWAWHPGVCSFFFKFSVIVFVNLESLKPSTWLLNFYIHRSLKEQLSLCHMDNNCIAIQRIQKVGPACKTTLNTSTYNCLALTSCSMELVKCHLQAERELRLTGRTSLDSWR